MSKFDRHHPEKLALLEYFDAEIPKRQARKIQGHVESCWQCRAELEELHSIANLCVRYRSQVLVPCAGAPPRPWGTLDFASVDAGIAAESPFRRVVDWLSGRRSGALRWALSGAVAIALSVAIVRHLRETPGVQAAALLQKAVAASDARPRVIKKLRVRTATQNMTRVIGGVPVRVTTAENEIAAWFRAARYDWSDPLSARAYSAWRETLIRKTDEVASADPQIYSIKTTTTDNELISATLKLRKADLTPLEARFEFRNHQWLEIAELGDQPDPAGMVARAAGATPRQPGAPSQPSPAEVEASPAASAKEELQVAVALHEIGADLGDPLEIARRGGEIVVSGTGVAPQRRQQIHDALDRLPHVVVRFSDPDFPAGTPAQSEPETTRDAVTAEGQKYSSRLEARLGGRPQFERFSGQLLDWTDSAMSRAYALRRLGQQFPEASEQEMSPRDRKILRTMAHDHLAALRKDLDRIRTAVKPVLTDVRPAEPIQGIPSRVWQLQTEPLLKSARHMETLLASVLGITAVPPSSDTPSQFLIALSQLTTEIEHCQRVLSYD